MEDMMRLIAMTAAAALLAGCTRDNPTVSVSAPVPNLGYYFVNGKSAMDLAGGPSQDIMLLMDSNGRVVKDWSSSGPGTFQEFMAGGLAGLMQAGGFAGGMAMLR